MLSTLKFGRHLCRYVTENRRINQVLSCGFKESFNNRTYHLYTLKKNLMAETNLVKNLQAVQNFSTANVDELIVKHYPDGGKFCVEIDGVGSAYLEYERKNDLVIIKHTEVPSELGGRGIGKVLAKVRRRHN